MTTSGSTNFTLTTAEIIRDALLLCNAIEENETVGVTQYNDANRQLNIFVKKINTRKPLWGAVDHTIPLYGNKQVYSIGPGGNKNINRPMAIGKQARSVTGTNETPIELISRDEYMALPVKSTAGLANVFYYDQQLTLGNLYVWPVSSTAATELSDGVLDNWTVSATATEYYYTGTGLSSEPYFVFIDNAGTMVEMTEGTAGSLSQYQYAWGDNDSLGTDTLYVWSASDPDLTSGSVSALTIDPNKLIITTHRTLDDFDSETDTPDLPQEAYEMLVWGLAYRLAPQYNPGRVAGLKGLADQFYQEFLSSDSEPANLQIVPRVR